MPRLRSRRAAALLTLCALPLASCGGGAGHLTASVDSLDFGLVAHAEEPLRRFHLTNEGQRSVVISAIEPSCKACLRVEPGWRRSLAAGEQTEVVVHLTTALVPAQKLEGKSLHVVSDDEERPLLQIPIHGEIETRVALSPALVLVGPGDAAGRAGPRLIRLRAGHGYEATLDKVEILRPDWFEVKPTKVIGGYDLLLSIKPDPARRGKADTFVRFHATVTGRGLPPQKYDDLRVTIQGTW